MQKAVIVNCGPESRKALDLNNLLCEGWKVVITEQFHSSIGGNSNAFALGAVLVIVEKE